MILLALGVRGGGSCSYLLWTRACSTLVVLSEGGAPAEFWLITERNFSSSLVLSVFPAPLSPLKSKKVGSRVSVFFTLFCWAFLFSLTWWGRTGCRVSSTGSGNTRLPQQRCEEAAPPSGVCCTEQWQWRHRGLRSVYMDSLLPR